MAQQSVAVDETAASADASDQYLAEYDGSFVARWDRLVGWEARARSEGDFFIELLREAGARRVLDAATGSGFHAVSLAQAGFDVVATDGSAAMVEQARRNLAERDLDVRAEVADWRGLDAVVGTGFDAVLCLGNSLGHLFAEDDLDAAVRGFAGVLKPGGLLLLDQRNYDAVLDGTLPTKRQTYCCVGENSSVDLERTREGHVRIVYGLDGGTFTRSIETHPWRRARIRRAMTDAGFEGLRMFGDFEETFDPDAVEFIVHAARRGA